jgi:hypothetical protein
MQNETKNQDLFSTRCYIVAPRHQAHAGPFAINVHWTFIERSVLFGRLAVSCLLNIDETLKLDSFFYLFFFSIDEKKQKSRLILIYLNSKSYSTHAPRPLRSLGAYRFIQFEFLRKLKVGRF